MIVRELKNSRAVPFLSYKRDEPRPSVLSDQAGNIRFNNRSCDIRIILSLERDLAGRRSVISPFAHMYENALNAYTYISPNRDLK